MLADWKSGDGVPCVDFGDTGGRARLVSPDGMYGTGGQNKDADAKAWAAIYRVQSHDIVPIWSCHGGNVYDWRRILRTPAESGVACSAQFPVSTSVTAALAR